MCIVVVVFFTNNFKCINGVCFSKSMSHLCLFMRHTIINKIIVYMQKLLINVFDTCTNLLLYNNNLL